MVFRQTKDSVGDTHTADSRPEYPTPPGAPLSRLLSASGTRTGLCLFRGRLVAFWTLLGGL